MMHKIIVTSSFYRNYFVFETLLDDVNGRIDTRLVGVYFTATSSIK